MSITNPNLFGCGSYYKHALKTHNPSRGWPCLHDVVGQGLTECKELKAKSFVKECLPILRFHEFIHQWMISS